MISTRSKFYYGHLIDTSNNTFIFDEGSGLIVATIPIGGYSLTTFMYALQNSLNSYGDLVYSCTLNRTTRKITISSTANFSLEVSSTGSGISVYPLMGFTLDKTGASSYTSDVASGSEYLPQYLLQNYLPHGHNKKFLSGSVKTSGSGISEIVSFGRVSDFEMDLNFITNHEMSVDAPVENNSSGVSDAISFLDYITTKSPIEFMEDRNTPSSYVQGFLLSTDDSKDGISYKLMELFDKGLTGFYDIGKLVFRKID